MPFMIYSGAGRHMLTLDKKRSVIKISQVQELILHTLPIGGLIVYNNTKEIEYDETLDLVVQILFLMSASLTMLEILVFYGYKCAGNNIEVQKSTGNPKVERATFFKIGIFSVLACVGAICVGIFVFKEQNCLPDKWYIEDHAICSSCVVKFG